MTARYYFDHAATGWPKHPDVIDAMADYLRNVGASAGRGVYRSAGVAGDIIADTRRRLAGLVLAPDPSSISLHPGGTAACNAALFGWIRPGDHVVTTAAEHNAVLRPLHHLTTHRAVDLTVVPLDDGGRVDAQTVLDAVRPTTRLVAVTGASNVTGYASPVTNVAAGLRDTPTLLFVDAAQSIGWLPTDVAVGIDLLAAPGHKAIGGPPGTGFLYAAPSVRGEGHPPQYGGTGTAGDTLAMPSDYPGRMEAGSMNVPALAGWCVALDRLNVDANETGRIVDALMSACDVEGFHSVASRPDVPLISGSVDGYDATDAAIILSDHFGIECRSGHHCAAAVHPAVGSPPGGLVRFSSGRETTAEDYATLRRALAELS